MSDERASTINTLRDIAQALHADQSATAVEILGSVGPEAADGRPSAAQLAVVALESLDSWFADHQLHNGAVRVPLRDIPRSIRNMTPAISALAGKGRALRSAASLLQRNPQQEVAGAGAYMVAATLETLAERQETDFGALLDQLLPEQEVAEPVTAPAPVATPEPVAAPQEPAAHDVVDVVDETVETPTADETDPAAQYTAILETRFMAGVKEFNQWMGESHPVTGTGLPKRADIQAVAATIGIDAEGVAKKPVEEEPVASDTDLTIAAQPQPTRYATSAQAIAELMAFWNTLQETGLAEVTSTKIQPGANAIEFGFEDTQHLAAAQNLVAEYVYQTLTHDADDDAAARTARLIIEPATVDTTEGVLIPRLRQLETMGLIEIVDGKPVITPGLGTPVVNGATKAAD